MNYYSMNLHNAKEVLAQLNTVWQFNTAGLINAMPIPLKKKATNVDTLCIPDEALCVDGDDHRTIQAIITSLSDEAYVIDIQNNVQLVSIEDAFDFFEANITIVAKDFSWIFCSTVVFSGIGIALIFGGETLQQHIKEKLQHLEEYFGTW